MRVLVCGSRDFEDVNALRMILFGVAGPGSNSVVIHGDARGADKLAGHVAKEEWGAEVKAYPADWQMYKKAAGHIRNQLMLDEGKPDVCFAFVNKPLEESKGTADMVRRAREAGVPTYVISSA